MHWSLRSKFLAQSTKSLLDEVSLWTAKFQKKILIWHASACQLRRLSTIEWEIKTTGGQILWKSFIWWNCLLREARDALITDTFKVRLGQECKHLLSNISILLHVILMKILWLERAQHSLPLYLSANHSFPPLKLPIMFIAMVTEHGMYLRQDDICIFSCFNRYSV